MWQSGTQDTSFSADGGFSRDGDAAGRGGGASKVTNLVHMHIADYLQQGEETLVCGQPVDMVVFVGKVTGIDPGASMIDYDLEDSTGSIKLKALIDPKDEQSSVNISSYARIVCTPKIMSGHKTGLVLRIFPLPYDPDEMKCHALRVKYDKLRIMEAGLRREMPTGGSANGSSANDDRLAPTVGSGGGGPRDVVLNAIQQVIRGMSDPDRGAYVGDVVSALRGKLDPAEVKKIITDDLVADGTLFSTLDDDHYNLT